MKLKESDKLVPEQAQWEEMVDWFWHIPPPPLSHCSQLSLNGQFLHSLQSAQNMFLEMCQNVQLQKHAGVLFFFVLLTFIKF